MSVGVSIIFNYVSASCGLILSVSYMFNIFLCSYSVSTNCSYGSIYYCGN